MSQEKDNKTTANTMLSEAREKPPCQCGRAWRHRKRRRQARESGAIPVVVDDDSVFVRLNQWLREGGRKFSQAHLKPAVFAETGRGLMAIRPVHAGEVLVSIPEEVLVTTNRVMQDVVLRKALHDSHVKFRAMDVLTLFLLYHKFLGEASQWTEYLDSLPFEYSVPAYCSREEASVLPEVLKVHKLKQDEDVSQCYAHIQAAVSTSAYLQSIFSSLCIEDVRWGWFTVNTRAVFLKNQNPPPVVVGNDVCALAPYLDLLNHTHTAQVEAHLNQANGCYEIVTQVPYSQYEQVFINYGPHDNLKLYVEYGFILPENPHSHVPVALPEVVCVAKEVLGQDSSDFGSKVHLISFHGLDKNLGVSAEGPTWGLEAAVTLCLVPRHQVSQGWQLVCQDLTGVGHRRKVLTCLQRLMQQKLQQLEGCLQDITNFAQKSAALSVAEALVQQWCTTLRSALEVQGAARGTH